MCVGGCELEEEEAMAERSLEEPRGAIKACTGATLALPVANHDGASYSKPYSRNGHTSRSHCPAVWVPYSRFSVRYIIHPYTSYTIHHHTPSLRISHIPIDTDAYEAAPYECAQLRPLMARDHLKMWHIYRKRARCHVVVFCVTQRAKSKLREASV